MATRVVHAFVSGIDDGGPASRVQPQRDWNDDHVVELSPMLTVLDILTPAPNKLAYMVDANNAALTDLTALARTLLSKATISEMSTLLEVLPLAGGIMTGNTIIPEPVGSSHPATKGYVDTLLSGYKPKQSVKAASVANVNVASAPASLDGVTGVAGDRWALLVQTAPSENGIYIFNAAGAALTRADDFDSWAEIPGAQFLVEEGSTRADTGWVATANQGGTLGVTAITFSQYFGSNLFQPANANLTAFAALVGAADKLAYFTGAGALTLADFTTLGRTFAALANAAAGRTALALGTSATLNVGTGANEIVQRDSSGNYPTGDGSAISNVSSNTPAGQCYLALSGANLLLSRSGGRFLFIDQVNRSIPSAGVSLAPTGITTTNGIGGGQVHAIYAYMNAGVMTLERSSTDVATDTTDGHLIKNGDPTRSFVGYWAASANDTWHTSAVMGISWFNPKHKSVSASQSGSGITNSEVQSANRLSFISAANRATFFTYNGRILVTGVGSQDQSFNLGIDGNTNPLLAATSTRVNDVGGGDGYPFSDAGWAQIAAGSHYVTSFATASGGSAATINVYIVVTVLG